MLAMLARLRLSVKIGRQAPARSRRSAAPATSGAKADNVGNGLRGLLFPIHPTDRRNAEAAHLAIEIAAFDAEHLGGPRDVSLLRRECTQYVVALELIACLMQRHDRRGALGRGPGRPIQE